MRRILGSAFPFDCGARRRPAQSHGPPNKALKLTSARGFASSALAA